MAITAKTTWFKDIPPGCTIEVWVELSAGAVQTDFTFSNLPSATPDQNWDNQVLLRTPQNPEAKATAALQGPVACVLFAEAVATANGTQGEVVIQVLDGTGERIRREVWKLDAMAKSDALNGLHVLYLA